MAKITCSEYNGTGRSQNGAAMPVLGKRYWKQTGLTAPDGTSRKTDAFVGTTVRLCSDVALHVEYDGTADPTADTDSDYYAAGMPIILNVMPGGKIAYLAAA